MHFPGGGGGGGTGGGGWGGGGGGGGVGGYWSEWSEGDVCMALPSLRNLGAKFSDTSFPHFKNYFTQIGPCYV